MSLIQDVLYAARLLRRSPVFTFTAVLSLAIGIAGNAAIFSLADALLLRQPPGVADPATLVDVGRSQDGKGFDNFSYPNFEDYRDRQSVFTGIAAHRFGEAFGLGLGDGADRVWGTGVSWNYFDVVGTPFVLGRGFRPEEDRKNGANQVAVISDSLWRQKFQGTPGILGRTVRVNGRPFTIVGVTAPGFTGTTIASSDLWIPMTAYPATTGRDDGLLTNRRAVWHTALGRLKPGVSIEQAAAQMSSIAAALEREYPAENRGKGLALATAGRVPGDARTILAAFLALLFALVGLVLLIACTNVAGMQLARGIARSREVAVRLAVGAGRGRVIRQLVTESLIIALLGAAVGIVAAIWMIGTLRAFIPSLPVALAVEFRLDWRVVGFSVVLATLTGVLFGLVPALQAARTDLVSTLKSDGGGRNPRRQRLRQLFVGAQVAMSVLLVVCALLFARSLQHAGSIDPGFVADGVDIVSLDFRLAGYDESSGGPFAERILDRVGRIPGVRSSAFARMVPLTGSGLGLGGIKLPGDAVERREIQPEWNIITPAYFETITAALVRGRAFSPSDRAGAPDVVIVNETFARRAWPGQDPIDKVLLQEGGPREQDRQLHVVGVAKDAKYRSIGEEPRPFIFVPHAQQYSGDMWLFVKRQGASAVPAVRALIQQMNPNLPIVSATSLAEMTAIGLLPQRVAGSVAGSFGVVGLLLACIGIYGITSFTVTQRTREIGIRVALGALRADVVRLIVGQAMRLAMAGAAAGVLLAVGVTRFLSSLLYGIQPLDPVSLGGAVVLFAAMALVASLVPARRAAAVNPVEALRTE